MEDAIRMFRTRLFLAFNDWIEQNREAIGDKWHSKLLKQTKEAADNCDTAIKIMGTALWMFNMIAGFGVQAGIGPNNVNLQGIPEQLDEKSTKRILNLCAACISLQYLPPEYAKRQIPIISSKHFSLKLWLETR